MIKVTANTTELRRALDAYAKARRGKSYPYIVNRMLRNVAAHAVRLTGKANRAKIAWELGKVADEIVVLELKTKVRKDGTSKSYYTRAEKYKKPRK